MIREISIAELECLTPMAAAFHRRMNLPGTFSKAAFMRTWEKLIGHKSGFVCARCSEQPVEAVGMIVAGDMFTGSVMACSAFWMFTDSPKGLEAGLLYLHIEAKCAELGVEQLIISTLKSSPRAAAADAFLVGAGFNPIETAHRKLMQ